MILETNKINKQVKISVKRLTNIMNHVKNRQAGTEDKAEELGHTVEVKDELKKHMNRMWESLGLSYKDLGFKSWA